MRNLSPRTNVVLLIVFAASMVGIWMTPVLMAGFPHVVPGGLNIARSFSETGIVTTGNARLLAVIIAWLEPLIGWHNLIGWSSISALALALSLLPLWYCVRRLFDVRTAWITIILFSLMPLYWYEAVRQQGYTFALLFLFCGAAAYLASQHRSRWLGVALFGFFFGLTLGSRDAFIALIPWLVIGYLWSYRADWRRAVMRIVLGLGVAYCSFTLPLLSNVWHGEPASILLPTLDRGQPATGHLYPDDYIYAFEREAYDERIRSRMDKAPFIERQQTAYVRYHFGVEVWGPVQRIVQGIWLFAHSFPALIAQDTVGGAFLWLLIVPGFAILFRTKRRLCVQMIGLWLSMELLLRFVLSFSRSHLMDIGWILPILAAVGVVTIADLLAKHRKKSTSLLTIAIVAIASIQLVQANRILFARLYAKSFVPLAYAAAPVLDALPPGSVVAHPRAYHYVALSDIPNVNISRETVDWFSQRHTLRRPFEHYSVTHILGYSDAEAALITSALPSIEVIALPQNGSPIELTPLKKYLLNVLR